MLLRETIIMGMNHLLADLQNNCLLHSHHLCFTPVLLAFDSELFYTSHCMSRGQLRAEVFNTTKTVSVATACADRTLAGNYKCMQVLSVRMACSAHSHDADGDGHIWIMFRPNHVVLDEPVITSS